MVTCFECNRTIPSDEWAQVRNGELVCKQCASTMLGPTPKPAPGVIDQIIKAKEILDKLPKPNVVHTRHPGWHHTLGCPLNGTEVLWCECGLKNDPLVNSGILKGDQGGDDVRPGVGVRSAAADLLGGNTPGQGPEARA